MLPIVEDGDQRRAREHKEAAVRAIRSLVAGLDLAGLPQFISLEGEMATGTPYGGHVHVGGANARVVQALADFLHDHAHCTGRIISGEIMPTPVAELPPVRTELNP
ncbi:hypothetical protein P3T36_000138 [Kitasatospora sp. MAP12-15]|uniref:hypothetical protein n=1 Tax=unclassified Kitasatospora TaxID=2633591 RepID=UPI002473B1A3|nr:hypothetical protein [Kitasatospora sp. MAP12-44]MDH6109366.1 hypothetical protein [Kitasatospora sp. MAP12-44]